jgi:hypothetical protein
MVYTAGSAETSRLIYQFRRRLIPEYRKLVTALRSSHDDESLFQAYRQYIAGP